MNLEFAMYDYNVVVSDVQYEKVGGSYDYDAPSDMDYTGYEDLLGFNIDSIHDLQNKGKMLEPKQEGEFINEHYQEIYDTILKLCRAWYSSPNGSDNEEWYP